MKDILKLPSSKLNKNEKKKKTEGNIAKVKPLTQN